MPTIDPIAPIAGGNLVPAAPGQTIGSASGNLAPTAPGASASTGGGNLAPTAPGASASTGGGNLAPAVPGAAPDNVISRTLVLDAEFRPALPRDGEFKAAVTYYGKLCYSTDGTFDSGSGDATPPPNNLGPWAVTYYDGTIWKLDLYHHVTLAARWFCPITFAFDSPMAVPEWIFDSEVGAPPSGTEWGGLENNLFSFTGDNSSCRLHPMVNNFNTLLIYFDQVEGRPAWAEDATWNGESWDFNGSWSLVANSDGEWTFGDPGTGVHWTFSERVNDPTKFKIAATCDEPQSGNPVFRLFVEAPGQIANDESPLSPSAPGQSAPAFSGNLSPTAPGQSAPAFSGNLSPSAPGAIV